MAYSGTYDGVDWAIEGKILYLGDEDGYDQYFTYREDRTWQDYPWSTHTYVQKVIFRGIVYGQGSMAYMFYDYRNLTTIQNLQNFDFYGITKTDYMFYNTEITSIDLSNKGCYNLNSMERMFAYCSRLKTVNFSGSTFGYEVNMTEMFMSCTALQSINFTNTGVIAKNMTKTFVGCSSLTTLTNLNIQFSEENEGIDLCFWLCSVLNTNLIVSGVDGPSSYSKVFQDTAQPISIQFEEDNISNEAKEIWETIAKQRTNVYIVTNNPTSPQIIIAGERGKYENSIWTADDESGNDLKINYQYTLYNDTLPVGVTNSVSQISTNLSSDSNWTETKIDANNTIYYKSNSNDTDSHNITISITDAYNKIGRATVTIAGIYALLDLKAGGEGMAIGKVAEKKGLEIRFPTMIGEGLSTPLVDNFIKTNDTEVVQNKEYWQYDSTSETYIQVSNPTSEDLSTYYEKTQEIDLNKYQLVIGKYNNIDNDALFIVGNGYNESTPHNIMTISQNKINFYTPVGTSDNSFYLDFYQTGDDSHYADLRYRKVDHQSNYSTHNIDLEALNIDTTNNNVYDSIIQTGNERSIKLLARQRPSQYVYTPISQSILQVNADSITMDSDNISISGNLTLANHSSPIGDVYEHTDSDVSLTSTAAQTQNTGKTILSCTGEHIIPAGCWVGFIYVNFSAGASTVVGFNMSTSNTSATWSTQMHASEQNYGTRIRQPVTITIANDTAYYVRAWSGEGCTVNTVTVRLMRIK